MLSQIVSATSNEETVVSFADSFEVNRRVAVTKNGADDDVVFTEGGDSVRIAAVHESNAGMIVTSLLSRSIFVSTSSSLALRHIEPVDSGD